jgi:hypothetical protein
MKDFCLKEGYNSLIWHKFKDELAFFLGVTVSRQFLKKAGEI